MSQYRSGRIGVDRLGGVPSLTEVVEAVQTWPSCADVGWWPLAVGPDGSHGPQLVRGLRVER